MDEEIRQALNEVQEMKKMCGNINMKLTNIVTQRGQNWKKKLEAEYHRGLEEGYERGLTEGKKAFDLLDAERDSEYQQGLDDAWECAKKLFSSMADSDIEKAFPIEWNNGGFYALMNLQPQEAIEKLKAYEEKQKTDNCIEIGDEVKWDGNKCIVTYRHIDINTGVIRDYDLLACDGSLVVHVKKCSFAKTGRHFDIASILKEMQND